jgi:hypothetical protein
VKITDYISFTIGRLPKGYVFTYADFTTEVNKKEAVIKALNRMAAAGKINKLSKGKFYKPESSAFGDLQPNFYQVVKDLLEDNGKISGYLTGYSIYNQLGLTTQLSNTIQIGKNTIRPSMKRDRYKISFIKQKNTITKENIPLLQILDSIRFLKKIPDTTNTQAINRLKSILKSLPEKDCKTIVRLALKYPPATRTLTGAILEDSGKSALTESLAKSLNPITTFKISGLQNILSSANKWNIKE